MVSGLDYQRSFWVKRLIFLLKGKWEHCMNIFSIDLGDTLGVRFGFPLH